MASRELMGAVLSHIENSGKMSLDTLRDRLKAMSASERDEFFETYQSKFLGEKVETAPPETSGAEAFAAGSISATTFGQAPRIMAASDVMAGSMGMFPQGPTAEEIDKLKAVAAAPGATEADILEASQQVTPVGLKRIKGAEQARALYKEQTELYKGKFAQAQEEHPLLYTLGEFQGFLSPGQTAAWKAGTKALKSVVPGKRLLGFAEAVANTALPEAIEGGARSTMALAGRSAVGRGLVRTGRNLVETTGGLLGMNLAEASAERLMGSTPEKSIPEVVGESLAGGALFGGATSGVARLFEATKYGTKGAISAGKKLLGYMSPGTERLLKDMDKTAAIREGGVEALQARVTQAAGELGTYIDSARQSLADDLIASENRFVQEGANDLSRLMADELHTVSMEIAGAAEAKTGKAAEAILTGALERTTAALDNSAELIDKTYKANIGRVYEANRATNINGARLGNQILEMMAEPGVGLLRRNEKGIFVPVSKELENELARTDPGTVGHLYKLAMALRKRGTINFRILDKEWKQPLGDATEFYGTGSPASNLQERTWGILRNALAEADVTKTGFNEVSSYYEGSRAALTTARKALRAMDRTAPKELREAGLFNWSDRKQQVKRLARIMAATEKSAQKIEEFSGSDQFSKIVHENMREAKTFLETSAKLQPEAERIAARLREAFSRPGGNVAAEAEITEIADLLRKKTLLDRARNVATKEATVAQLSNVADASKNSRLRNLVKYRYKNLEPLLRDVEAKQRQLKELDEVFPSNIFDLYNALVGRAEAVNPIVEEKWKAFLGLFPKEAKVLAENAQFLTDAFRALSPKAELGKAATMGTAAVVGATKPVTMSLALWYMFRNAPVQMALFLRKYGGYSEAMANAVAGKMSRVASGMDRFFESGGAARMMMGDLAKGAKGQVSQLRGPRGAGAVAKSMGFGGSE